MASTADDSLGVHASNNVSRFFTREEEQGPSFSVSSTSTTSIASTSNISGSTTPTSSSSNRSFPPAFTSASGSQRLQLLAASLNSNPSSSSRTLPPPIRSPIPSPSSSSSSVNYSISENERINSLWSTSTRIENEIIALNELLNRSREGILNLQRSAESRARELRELEEEKRRLEEGLGGLRNGRGRGGQLDGSRYPDNEEIEGQRRERRWDSYEETEDLDGGEEEEDADGNKINLDEEPEDEEEPFLEEFYSDPNNLEAGIISYRINYTLLKVKKESRSNCDSVKKRVKYDIFEKMLKRGEMDKNGEIIGEWQYLYRVDKPPGKREDNVGR